MIPELLHDRQYYCHEYQLLTSDRLKEPRQRKKKNKATKEKSKNESCFRRCSGGGTTKIMINIKRVINAI